MSEEIEDITETVKNVEGKVNILTTSVIDYTALKRQYIIDYFAAYNNWERTITSANLSGYSNFAERNREAIERMYEAKHQYNLKEGEIELFIDDPEFYEARKDLTIETLKSLHEFEKGSSKIIEIHNNRSTNPNFHDDLSEILDNYRKKSVEDLKIIFEHRRKLINILTVYIKDLMK